MASAATPTPPSRDPEDILAALDPTGELRRSDRPRTLAAVAELLGVDPSTVFRWGKKGTSLDGTRVRLPMLRVGGRWMVRPSSLSAYLSRLNDASRTGLVEQAAPGAKYRDEARAQAAERELDRLGF